MSSAASCTFVFLVASIANTMDQDMAKSSRLKRSINGTIYKYFKRVTYFSTYAADLLSRCNS